MKTGSNGWKGWLLSGLIGICLFCPASGECAGIARVAEFTGEAVILSGLNMDGVKMPGQPVKSGDMVQTQQGAVQIAFDDGSLLKINPYTTVSVQESAEEGGILIFRTKKPALRITVLVGEVRFKSGASGRSEYLQSPLAVCKLSGFDGEFCYDGRNTYLNIRHGDAVITGPVLKEPFQYAGESTAQGNAVYQKVSRLYERNWPAVAAGLAPDINASRIAALDVVKAAADALSTNPDAAIRKEAVRASVWAAECRALYEAAASAEREAKAATAASQKAAAAQREAEGAAARAAKAQGEARDKAGLAAQSAEEATQAYRDTDRTSTSLLEPTSKAAAEAATAASEAQAAVDASVTEKDTAVKAAAKATAEARAAREAAERAARAADLKAAK